MVNLSAIALGLIRAQTDSVMENSVPPHLHEARPANVVAGKAHRIRQEQIRLLTAQGPTALLVSGAVVLVVLALLWGLTDPVWLLLWGAVQFIITFARFWQIIVYRRQEPDRDQLEKWLAVYLIWTGIGGMTWGFLVLFLSSSWPLSHLIMTYMILTGVMVASISSLAVIYRAYLLFMIPTLVAVCAWPLSQGDMNYSIVGGAGLLLGVLLLIIARTYHSATLRLIALQIDNADLAEELLTRNNEITKEIEVRECTQEELKRERQLFLEGPVVLFRCAARKGWPIEYISPNVLQFGFNFEMLMEERTPYESFIHPDDVGKVMSAEMTEHGIFGMPFVEMDYRIVLPDKRTRWIYSYTMPVYNAYGDITHYDGYLLDITALKLTEHALTKEKERAQVTLYSIADAVITTDVNGRIETMNPIAEQLTGWSLEEAKSMPLTRAYQVSDEETGEFLDDPLSHCLNTDRVTTQTRHVLLHRRDGSTFPIRHSTAAICSPGGEAIGAALVFHDMSETRSMAQQLEYHATHDSLTDLINRREFETRLQHALRVAREEQKQHVCLYMDLDQFKIVNDTCGHIAGDELLRQIALILQHQLRGSDTLARLGGDEFGVLLEGCSLEEGERIAETLRTTVKEFRFVWEDKAFEIGASIGIVLLTDKIQDVGNVLSKADVACYAAKDLGRNRVHAYQEADVELSRRQGEMQWVSQITRALEEHRLVLYYQDIVALQESSAHERQIEILLRMLDENADIVPPNAFLPAAERYNLMPAIDRWVINNTFAWYKTNAAGKSMKCVINISGTSLSDAKFLDYIRAQFDHHEVPPSVICFEITETAAIANLTTASRFMHELKALGCSFSLDDFGSGLSSFAYLKSLPVDYLKIDGRFVRDMLTDPVDCTMVSAINEVGQSMGLRTIAEYAESEAIVQELRRLAVDYAQGYGVSKPRPLRRLSL
jgi:diguanylate cyclase (GGDEF)-like protein/PAS domain S-box-containing protein